MAQNRQVVHTQFSVDAGSGKSYVIRTSALPIKKVGEKSDSPSIARLEAQMLESQSRRNLQMQSETVDVAEANKQRSPFKKRPGEKTPRSRQTKLPSSYQIETATTGQSIPKIYDSIGRSGLRDKQRAVALFPDEDQEERLASYEMRRYGDAKALETVWQAITPSRKAAAPHLNTVDARKDLENSPLSQKGRNPADTASERRRKVRLPPFSKFDYPSITKLVKLQHMQKFESKHAQSTANLGSGRSQADDTRDTKDEGHDDAYEKAHSQERPARRGRPGTRQKTKFVLKKRSVDPAVVGAASLVTLRSHENASAQFQQQVMNQVSILEANKPQASLRSTARSSERAKDLTARSAKGNEYGDLSTRERKADVKADGAAYMHALSSKSAVNLYPSSSMGGSILK